MSTSKYLSESGWKDAATKNNVKDNGLLKKLADFKRIGEDKPDDALKLLDEVLKLATQLKKDKKTPATAGKYLDELVSAAETAQRDTTKAKAESDKAAKAKAEADKKAQAESAKKGEEEHDDEDAEASELLTTRLKPLLKLVAKGERMHTLVAKSGKKVVVLLSRKPISPARRKLLADELGGGSTKYYPGHCSLEAGATTFVLKAEVAGLSKLIKVALLEQTGLRINKIKCRGEDGDDNDEDEGSEGGEAPEAVEGGEEDEGNARAQSSGASARSESSARSGSSGRSESGESSESGEQDAPREFVPGTDIRQPAQALAAAPQVWKGTRQLLQTNIDALKSAVQAQVAGEGAAFIEEINDNLQKLDRIMGKLDKRLTNALANALETQDAALRQEALRESKGILTEYIRYVGSEPLIEHLDKNPFGVNTNLKATLVKNLTQVAKAIG